VCRSVNWVDDYGLLLIKNRPKINHLSRNRVVSWSEGMFVFVCWKEGTYVC